MALMLFTLKPPPRWVYFQHVIDPGATNKPFPFYIFAFNTLPPSTPLRHSHTLPPKNIFTERKN